MTMRISQFVLFATISTLCCAQDLTVKCTVNATCASIGEPFDPAMAYSVAPANLGAIDNNRGVYGYRPDSFKFTNNSATLTATISAPTVPAGYMADTNCYVGSTAHAFPYTLAAKAACTIGMAYVPLDIAPASGTITINYTESGGPCASGCTLPIAVANASGRTAQLTVTNTSIPAAIPAFYQQTNGLHVAFPVTTPLSSQNTTFTIKNRGSATTATSLGVVIKEGNIADPIAPTNFTITSNGCGTGAGSLAPAAFCTVIVNYTPLTIGAHRAMLQITSTNGGTVSLVQPEIYGEAVASLLTRTEGNPYCPVTDAPVYPGGVTTDGPATLPTKCINTTDTNINYAGNTITTYTKKYEVCASGCTYTAVGGAGGAMQAVAADATCGAWISIHAQDGSGNLSIANDYIRDTDWPTTWNAISLGHLPVTPCTLNNYMTTDHLSSLPPAGNRISPAWEGYSMLPGYPPYAQPAGGPGNYVPVLVQSAVNVETMRIPKALGMKWRFVGIHFSGSSTLQEGNTPIVTSAYSNDAAVDYPDCIGSPPTTTSGSAPWYVAYMCTPNESIIFDRVLVSGTVNWINMCLTCIHGAGIALNATSHGVVENSYIADIHCDSFNTVGAIAVGPCTTDAKALSAGGSGYVVTSGNKIYNNFLSSASIPFLSGGGRTTQTPTDLMFINNTIYKPWFYFNSNTYGQLGMPPQLFATPGAAEFPPIKGGFELKNYNRVLVENLAILHCTNTGQADQFGECFHLNNLNNPNDGQIGCGKSTTPTNPCTGFIAPATSYNIPAVTPASSFAGVAVSNITVRNLLMLNLNKCFLIGNEFNDPNTYQLMPPVGLMGPYSIHDVLCDDMDGVKYGPHGGGGFNRLASYTVSPPIIPLSNFRAYCPSGVNCTWNSWPGFISNNVNDRGRSASTNPFNHTFQRVTAISNTMNFANPPVAQISNALGSIGGSDRSDSAVVYDASASQSGGTCNVTVHYVSAQLVNISASTTKNLVFHQTPDIGLPAASGGKDWSALPNITVDSLITGPPAGFVGHFTGTCPYVTSFSQAGLVYPGSSLPNLPSNPFLGLVDADNGPVVKYTGMRVLDSIFLGDYQGPATGSPSYDINWDGSATTAGYCWSGNMMIPKSGPNTLVLTIPVNYPGCIPSDVFVRQNCIVGAGGTGCSAGTGTFADVALSFTHYVDGSWWNGIFGGTNNYTVGSTASTYSTSGGPIGVSPSALLTNLYGVLDGVAGGAAPPAPPITAPALTMFAKARRP